MFSFLPFAVPVVFSSWSLKSSGVASFDDDFCFRVAVASSTAQVSGGPLEAETSPRIESWLAWHGSSLTYIDSRTQCNPAIGAPACSACSDFHFSPNFIPSAGSVHASAKRATHCCQACCCSEKRVSRPFTSFTEPSDEIVNSMFLPLGSTRCLSQSGFLSPGFFNQTPESKVRNRPRAWIAALLPSCCTS